MVIEIVQLPTNTRVLVDESANAKFSWKFTSPWLGQEEVDYNVSSNLEGLEISNPNGIAEPAAVVEHDLEYSCTSNGLETATLTITAQSESVTHNWDILCMAAGTGSAEIRMYQGILAVQIYANTTDEDELEYKVVQSAPLVNERTTYVSAVLGHKDSTPPDVNIVVLGTTETVLDDQIDVTTISPEDGAIDFWTTEYVFEMPTELLDSRTPFEVRIDPDDLVVNENEDHNNHRVDYTELGIAFVDEPYDPVEIVVVPITGNQSAPENIEDLDVYSVMKDLLPVADYKISVGATLDMSQTTWDIENALVKVNEMRIVNGDSSKLYHGLFVHDERDGLCAVSYLEGSVSISAIPSQTCRTTTFVHEIGHNMGLSHAPGCGADDPDESYPYLDGGIGGEVGWFVSSKERIPNGTSHFYDFMGNCEDSFVSKYHYSKALEHWTDRSNFEPSKTNLVPAVDGEIIGTPPPDGLLLFGVIDDRSASWSMQMTRRTRLGVFNEFSPTSDYRLEVRSLAIGQLLHTQELTVYEIAHLHKRHWYAVVPYPSETKVGMVVFDGKNQVVFAEELELNPKSRNSTSAEEE